MTASPDAARPNFLVIVVDDMGYSDCEPFGGEIRTPNLRRLAESGARFRRFHTSSLCAPTRAMLLSGCDNHQAGLGVMQPLHAMNQYMQPGYEGYLNHSVPTMAELLGPAGYHTYLSGKWHVGITEDTRPAARGFERGVSLFSAAGAATSPMPVPSRRRRTSRTSTPRTIGSAPTSCPTTSTRRPPTSTR